MRFKEFADVDDTIVEYAIEEARLEVNDTWTANYNLAIVYLVAHYVSASVAAATNAGAGGGGSIASESIGRLSISYSQPNAANANAVPDDKTSTSYGRRYLEILGANFSGPLIV
jgi:hypothetical protein